MILFRYQCYQFPIFTDRFSFLFQLYDSQNYNGQNNEDMHSFLSNEMSIMRKYLYFIIFANQLSTLLPPNQNFMKALVKWLGLMFKQHCYIQYNANTRQVTCLFILLKVRNFFLLSCVLSQLNDIDSILMSRNNDLFHIKLFLMYTVNCLLFCFPIKLLVYIDYICRSSSNQCQSFLSLLKFSYLVKMNENVTNYFIKTN